MRNLPKRRFMIIGHRGACAHELENSIASFHMAIDMKAHMIELDVRRTKDGHIVVMHDPKINRVAKKSGMVEKLTLDELRACKLKNGEVIPTLSEVLKLAKGHCQVNVEIKSLHTEQGVITAIHHCGMQNSVIVSSMYPQVIKEVKRLSPRLRTALICVRLTEKNVELAASLQCYSIHARNVRVFPSLVAYAHEYDMRVFIWTINTMSQLHPLLRMRVDGVFTDAPDRIRESLLALKKRSKQKHVASANKRGLLTFFWKKEFSFR